MTTMKGEDKRDEEVLKTLEISAAEQENAASILHQVAERLERLSREMRKHQGSSIAATMIEARERVTGQ